MEAPYIFPILKIFSIFAEAKEFFDKNYGLIFFERDEKKLGIEDLAQGNRNLVIGEPGAGKTELLGKIKKHFNSEGKDAVLISLRQSDAIEQIDAFIKKKTKFEKVLLLDALDEVQASLFSAILQKISEVSEKHPNLPIYLSSRLVFISKYATSFPGYRFIAVPPFTEGQVREYLLESGKQKEDVEILLNRVIAFNHPIRVIQIPRYLSFLDKFLKEKDVDLTSIAAISRNELFEHFIYSKLESEKKLSSEKRLITKRVLEKLALTMEIYQTNEITEDELMSFFDELKSDLKNAVLAQIDLGIFYDNSLLKVSQNDLKKIQFENTEFQEYLAAKEITRFSEPSRAAFNFAVDQVTGEIYPSWFNAFTFLVDMQPDLLEQLVEFSGIRASETFKVVDEGFITFLGRINPQGIPHASRKQIFLDAFSYYQRTLQWMPWGLLSLLSGCYENSIEDGLKEYVAKSELEVGTKRYVRLGNVVHVVEYLLESGNSIDISYWREKLLAYVQDSNDNGVLQRHALSALTSLGDPTVIDQLPNLMNAEQLVMRAFLSFCRETAPNHQKSIEYFIEAVKRDDFYGRYGFQEITESEAIKKILRAFNSDENFRREYIKDTSLFREEDSKLVEHIRDVFDEEIGQLAKEALVYCTNIQIVYSAEKSSFVIGLWRLLKEKYSNFLTEMIGRIQKVPDEKHGLYFALDFFADVINKEDVESIIDAMINAGEKDSALSLMFNIKFSNRKDAEEIYEEGRKKLPVEYEGWEKAQAKARNKEERRKKNDDNELLKEFKTLLEPEPGKYSFGVFEYYTDNHDRLNSLLTDSDKNRLKDLITGTIFKFIDPAKLELTITSEHQGAKTYTMDQGVRLFGDALEAASILEIDLSVYRQKILNYLPFAYDKNLKIVLNHFTNITHKEIQSLLEVYREKKSDKWRYQLSNFIEICKRYNIIQSIPILRELVKDSRCDRYERETAMTVSDMLAHDPLFLKETFELYKDNENDTEKFLSYVANGILITQHADLEAVQWRLNEVLKRAAPFVREEGVHSVNDFESEIIHGHDFARPLMELRSAEHISSYLNLLGEAMQIWARGKEFHAYGEYLWDIICTYFEGLKEHGSFEPLHLLEKKISELKDQDGANWFASRVAQIRRAYLSFLGKPKNISEAVKKYNESHDFDNKKIQNSADLFRHVQDALETDLSRWIEGEGAYDLIVNKETESGKRNQHEKLVQRTLKTQIDNAFIKRGFQVEISRESQLLDEKRPDFLVRYGFVGPIVLEIKLSSNSDIQGSKANESDSFENMKRYMTGFGASHGVFVIIDDRGAKNLKEVKDIFETIPNVWVKSFECYSVAKKEHKIKGNQKKTTNTKTTRTNPKRKVSAKTVRTRKK